MEANDRVSQGSIRALLIFIPTTGKDHPVNSRSAISAINQAGALLVFPLDNRREPASIWSHFYPKEDMKWEWDEDGDDRVARLWRLRGDLSTTRKVIYTKWFRGRATYFSLPLFSALLRSLNPFGDLPETLSSNARKILGALQSESPLSTKELKRMTGLQGKPNEASYDKALQELWSRMLIVAYGEVDDGAFPSLAIGSTRVLFEELWAETFQKSAADAEREIGRKLAPPNLFFLHYQKLKKALIAPPTIKKLTEKRGKPTLQRRIASVIKFEDL